MLRINKEGKSKLQWDKVVDSGTRTAFGTGSQRDTQRNKGRYDLIPTSMLHRLAQHYENGAVKYGDNNWQKGQPLHQYYNSAVRHLNAIRNVDLSEDHFAAVIWNIAAMIHHIDEMLDNKLPIELDSFGIIQAVKEHYTFEQLKEYYNDPNETHVTPIRNVPVMVSGAMPEPLTQEAINKVLINQLGEYSSVTTGKVVWDKDRFNRGLVKLDPEELG